MFGTRQVRGNHCWVRRAMLQQYVMAHHSMVLPLTSLGFACHCQRASTRTAAHQQIYVLNLLRCRFAARPGDEGSSTSGASAVVSAEEQALEVGAVVCGTVALWCVSCRYSCVVIYWSPRRVVERVCRVRSTAQIASTIQGLPTCTQHPLFH